MRRLSFLLPLAGAALLGAPALSVPASAASTPASAVSSPSMAPGLASSGGTTPSFTPPLALSGPAGEPSIRNPRTSQKDAGLAAYISAPGGLGSNFW